MNHVDDLISSNLLENNLGYKNNSSELQDVDISSNVECEVKEGSILDSVVHVKIQLSKKFN